MYRQDQADFYNLVCVGAWGGTAAELLAWTQGVEADFGRDRTREMRNGPRTLDIDIEFFGDRQIHTPELTVPHPRILERPFVIKPLLEILANTADD
jgi:2-amino-4-hydroxy-6-hydroxymethyldihydropteridine diphosphokinase